MAIMQKGGGGASCRKEPGLVDTFKQINLAWALFFPQLEKFRVSLMGIVTQTKPKAKTSSCSKSSRMAQFRRYLTPEASERKRRSHNY